MRVISSLSDNLKKGFWTLFFRKSEKCLWECLIFTLVWGETEEKYLLKTLAISTGFVIVLTFAVKTFGICDRLILTFNVDFIPFQEFLMFFQLKSK